MRNLLNSNIYVLYVTIIGWGGWNVNVVEYRAMCHTDQLQHEDGTVADVEQRLVDNDAVRVTL